LRRFRRVDLAGLASRLNCAALHASSVSGVAFLRSDCRESATEWRPISNLSDRVAIIAGGNGCIGLGMARALARAGCAVSIWGRNARKNGEAMAELSGFGAPVEARASDVTDCAIGQAFAATLSAFGRVDGCFANAGVGGRGRHAFVDRPEDDWRRMFATNLDGVFHVFRSSCSI
jgi:NAD(P)-dependent dehydrogenase (short-subunit alcohol dehydrogenase family)